MENFVPMDREWSCPWCGEREEFDERQFPIRRKVSSENDNWLCFTTKYKKYIFISIIILLTLVIAINVYKFNKEKKIEKQSELFFQANQYIELEDYQNAKKNFKRN